jgi:hypothetical protein
MTPGDLRAHFRALCMLAVMSVWWGYMSWIHYLLPRGSEHLTGGSVYADLPFHLNITTSFLAGCNEAAHLFSSLMSSFYAGVTLAYPFMPDFYVAVLAAGGMTLRWALVTTSTVLLSALFALIYAFNYRMSGSVRVGALSVLELAAQRDHVTLTHHALDRARVALGQRLEQLLDAGRLHLFRRSRVRAGGAPSGPRGELLRAVWLFIVELRSGRWQRRRDGRRVGLSLHLRQLDGLLVCGNLNSRHRRRRWPPRPPRHEGQCAHHHHHLGDEHQHEWIFHRELQLHAPVEEQALIRPEGAEIAQPPPGHRTRVIPP